MLYGLLLATCLTVDDAPKPDTIVVCPPVFRQALDPWLAFRRQQGHCIALVSNEGSPQQIRAAIRRLADAQGIRFVVLIGDAEPASIANARVRCVPTHHAEAKVNIRWGSEPEIASDNWYADWNDDQVPDAAIGRLPADTPEELSRLVARIIAYEQSDDVGQWRQRINFVAGVGGFGALADAILETTTKKFLTDSIPSAYTTHMTYGSWRSPYCPDPRSFRRQTIQRLNEGCLFWVYIGHGNKRHLDYVRVPGGAVPILHADDCRRLACKNGAPIAVFLSCYAGAFDQPEDCLAEEMLRKDGGPIAVLSGSRITMPYAMSVMSNQMLHELFHERRSTLGEVFLHAKQRMIKPPGNNSTRTLLDGMARLISPAPQDLEGERSEHLLLFNILGDPLMRIRLPESIDVQGPEYAEAGKPLTVQLEPSFAGNTTVQLVCRRDRQTRRLPSRREFSATHEFLTAMNDTYDQANDQLWVAKKMSTAGSQPVEVSLAVPEKANGPCFVRVFSEGKGRFAAAAHEVYVRRPSKDLPEVGGKP